MNDTLHRKIIIYKIFSFHLLQLIKKQFTIKEDHRRETREEDKMKRFMYMYIYKQIIFIRSGYIRRSCRRDR